MIKSRPFLKWAGNKYRCLDHILQALPRAERLIEPFTGSGAVFINTEYPRYLLAEANIDLVNLFQSIQQEGISFIEYCASFFCAANNENTQYYNLRSQFNQCQDLRKRSALFLYLNRHCYNGLCRYNQKRIYNVPFGRYKKPYFPFDEMLNFHKKSQLVSFEHQDFRETFKKARPGDIIYCDPPYAPLTRETSFANYTGKSFSETEQITLAALAEEYAQRGITVVVSNHDTIFTRTLYQKAEICSFTVKRSISCHGGNRLAVKELVAIYR